MYKESEKQSLNIEPVYHLLFLRGFFTAPYTGNPTVIEVIGARKLLLKHKHSIKCNTGGTREG